MGQPYCNILKYAFCSIVSVLDCVVHEKEKTDNSEKFKPKRVISPFNTVARVIWFLTLNSYLCGEV